jgi:hypothetical protein
LRIGPASESRTSGVSGISAEVEIPGASMACDEKDGGRSVVEVRLKGIVLFGRPNWVAKTSPPPAAGR